MKTKHFILCCLVVLCSISTFAHDFEVNGIYYTKIGGGVYKATAMVTYKGSSSTAYDNEYSGNITIPTSVTYLGNTYPVTSIGSDAFYKCSRLTSVSIPSSVTSIGWDAFAGCSGLTSVTIGKSVTSIGTRAFSSCSALTSIVVPNSVTSIGENAFSNCYSLTSVSIGNGVTSIDWSAFSGCSNLEKIEVQTGNSAYHSSGNCLIETTPKKLVLGCKKSVIPEDGSVTSIGSKAFYFCSGLTSIAIPYSITTIENEAFRGCSGLNSVTWNAKNYADFSQTNTPFYYYKSNNSSNFDLRSQITYFTFGDSVQHIPTYLCDGMNNLVSITWNIKDYADFSSSSNVPFYDAHQNITSFTLGKNVEHIPAYLCYAMTKLENITIPKNIISIDTNAFYNCYNLNSIIVDDNNPYYHSSNSNCLVETATKTLILGCKTSAIPDNGSINKINSNAFYGCSGLTSVTIPASTTSIGIDAFYGCSGLTSVVWNAKNISKTIPSIFSSNTQLRSIIIGDSIEVIPANFCSGMNNLTSVTLSNSVTTMGKSAFANCSGLTSFTIPNSITSIGDYAFNGCTGLKSPVYNEHVFAYLQSAYSGVYTIPHGIKSIVGTAFSNCKNLISVIIPNSVNSIGGSTFEDCTALVSVTIPNSVTSLGSGTFKGCTGLLSISIPNSITTIEHSTFKDCTGLTSITLPNTITSIAGSAFMGCTGLTSITVPNSVTTLGTSVFSGCTNLTSVIIGTNVNSIGSSAFYGCNDLTSITWNAQNYNSIASVSNAPFYNVRSQITSFKFGNSIPVIPAYLCSGMKRLLSVSIPNDVSIILNNAFEGCTQLSVLEIGSGVTILGEKAFYNCSGINNFSIMAVTPPALGANTMYNVNNKIAITVPCGSETLYQNAAVWSDFSYIGDFSYTFSATSANSTMGSVQINQTPNCSNNAVATFTAIPKNGYRFMEWNDGDKNANRTINVTQDTVFTAYFEAVPVESISLSAGDLFIEKGKTAQVTVTITPANALNKKVTWSTSNGSVATVQNGNITAKEQGTATITATSEDGGFTATCEVTVTTPVSGILLDITSLELFVGTHQQITAIIQPEDATNQNVIWTSVDNSIASVESGLVTAIAAGTTTIIASTEDGNHTAECEVVVTDNTAVENISADNVSGVHKVLHNGTIYILRNGEKYTVDGRKVE